MTCSGVWDFATGLKVIAERGRLMYEESAPGAMAAVMGIEVSTLETVCQEYQDGWVGIANYNSPKQLVITGEQSTVDSIFPQLKEKGARRIFPLPVNGAFHSPLMENAQMKFDSFLQDIAMADPKITWISNNSATPVHDAETVRRHLVKQFCEPVRWWESMVLIEKECTSAIEVGAGKVLCGLAKQCCRDLLCSETSTWETTQKVIQKYGS